MNLFDRPVIFFFLSFTTGVVFLRLFTTHLPKLLRDLNPFNILVSLLSVIGLSASLLILGRIIYKTQR